MADARELKSISGSHRKNDPRDAEQLARLARVDVRLLHPVSLRTAKDATGPKRFAGAGYAGGNRRTS